MKISKLLLVVTLASFAIAACDSNDGMAEKAGKVVDETGAKIGRAATDAGNAIEDACEDTKKKLGADDTNC